MSVVILGGNERMERKYADLCREYDCDAKVFTKIQSGLRERIGNPDLLVLFTDTLSHKMVRTARSALKGVDTDVVHARTASVSTLRRVLAEKTGMAQ